MKRKYRPLKFKSTIASALLNKKYWFLYFWFVAIFSLVGLVYMGDQTYDSAPPVSNYVNQGGEVVVSVEDINAGKAIFHNRGLMNYGSFWGDGAGRGPDFTAEGLHLMTAAMQDFYKDQQGRSLSPDEQELIAVKVRREIKTNTWEPETNETVISEARMESFENVVDHYTRVFTDPTYSEAFRPTNYLTDPQEIRQLSAFVFWGSWVASTNRPGEDYTYTHNWPYDPEAGNHPSKDTYLWSFFSVFVLFAGIMLVLYLYGQMKSTGNDDPFQASYRSGILLSTPDLERGIIRPTQRKVYKFFVLAAIAFGLQILAGYLSVMDFADPFHERIAGILPFTVLRSYHTLLQIYWMFMCWVGYTIFFLPRLAPVPKHQGKLIDLLFWMCLVVGIGGIVGVYSGYNGLITGMMAYWFGSQGWEWMELGRFFQYLLLAAFSLWIYIIYRGVKPWITRKTFWSIPSWILWGSGCMVFFLFFGLFSTPDSNWAVADFWRWMVVHMWVEVTFEVFTTVIVTYVLYQLGMINKPMAERVIFLAVILFLATATLGVAHNFYWIAKPTGVIALGSVFSTLQILPLLLLTLDAWRVRREGSLGWERLQAGKQKYIMDSVWLFIIAVNFWNIFGAGVLGSLINLPIINYFEHATYLTGNHAHAAMFGVKGNVALAGVLFCAQHLMRPEDWNPRWVNISFWSLNIGLALMMFLSLFPVGIYQMMIIFEDGYWAARVQEVTTGETFRSFVSLRGIGVTVFSVGMLMMVWFILSRAHRLRGDSTKDTHSEEHLSTEWNRTSHYAD